MKPVYSTNHMKQRQGSLAPASIKKWLRYSYQQRNILRYFS
ncbi:hypothetical protein [Photorhabdus heterorhabditis]|nr:hypothetical protein [Photorhabdus heterorhabditis]